jgi:hypothetical protein
MTPPWVKKRVDLRRVDSGLFEQRHVAPPHESGGSAYDSGEKYPSRLAKIWSCWPVADLGSSRAALSENIDGFWAAALVTRRCGVTTASDHRNTGEDTEAEGGRSTPKHNTRRLQFWADIESG